MIDEARREQRPIAFRGVGEDVRVRRSCSGGEAEEVAGWCGWVDVGRYRREGKAPGSERLSREGEGEVRKTGCNQARIMELADSPCAVQDNLIPRRPTERLSDQIPKNAETL